MRLLIGICLIVGLFNCSPSLAVTGNELVENAHLYDGKTIIYQGEAIGDIMVRNGKHAWVNVNDGTYAIGVFSDKSLVKKIKRAGSYRYIGDTVRVKGVFHRACAVHGGDLDIHAMKISIVKDGYKIEHPIRREKVAIAIMLLVGVVVLIIIQWILKPRS